MAAGISSDLLGDHSSIRGKERKGDHVVIIQNQVDVRPKLGVRTMIGIFADDDLAHQRTAVPVAKLVQDVDNLLPLLKIVGLGDNSMRLPADLVQVDLAHVTHTIGDRLAPIHVVETEKLADHLVARVLGHPRRQVLQAQVFNHLIHTRRRQAAPESGRLQLCPRIPAQL